VGPEGEGDAAMVMLCLTFVSAAGILVYGESAQAHADRNPETLATKPRSDRQGFAREV